VDRSPNVNPRQDSLWDRLRDLMNAPHTSRWVVGTGLASVVVFYGAGSLIRATRPVAPLVVSEDSTAKESAAKGSEKLVVHVVGAVCVPGVVKLEPGSRVSDAIKAAGGPWSNAATDALNLAAKVEDGQKIIVPKRGTAAAAATKTTPTRLAGSPRTRPAPPRDFSGEIPVVPPGVMEIEPLPVAEPAAVAQRQSSPTQESRAPKEATSSVVSLNSASRAELETLPGIGPKTAEAIMAYRSERGAFTSIEELINVKGIGPKKMEKMRPFLRL